MDPARQGDCARRRIGHPLEAAFAPAPPGCRLIPFDAPRGLVECQLARTGQRRRRALPAETTGDRLDVSTDAAEKRRREARYAPPAEGRTPGSFGGAPEF